MSSDYGLKFFIQPEVDPKAASKAEAKLNQVVAQAAAAAKAGNEKVLRDLNIQAHQMMKKGGNPTLDVDVKMEYSSVTGALGKVKRMSASALDPLIKDYQKMTDIQGEAALNVKKEIQLQKESLAVLQRKQALLGRGSKRYKENARAQKLVVDQTKDLERVLRKVTTLSSLKGQLRTESQKLSMMSQYNVGLSKQGQLVTTLNQNWVKQKALVQGLSGQVSAAGAAAQGFGAKVAAAGQKMQMAFGWIAAVVAGMTAIAGSIGAITGRVKDIQAIKLTFDGLGKSVEAQNAVLDSAKNIALSYGVSLRKVEGAFRRLGPAILESGGSLKDTEGAIKSIAARTTMLGLNTEQTGRYIEAFAQVMGKGKLQSEELNQQFSELDGGLRGQLKNWLAANKGITDFEGAMKKGEITSGVFLEAFEAINEEIRQKFLRSIGDTQQAIEDMGKKGGMTLNQLNAKLQTLTSIGLESVGKALAPIGKELMKVYAAFVQVFTKIATEMPGVQKLFQGLGHVLGVIVKVALNSVLLLFGVLMKVINDVTMAVVNLYNAMKKLPVLGPLFKGLEEAGAALNANFDSGIDSFSKLSDATIGAKSELEKYNDEMAELIRMEEAKEITAEEFERKYAELMARRTEAVRKNAQEELDIETEKLNTMLEKRKGQLQRDNQIMQRKITGINRAKDEEVRAIDAVIKQLETKKSATKDMYDEQIADIKRTYEAAKRSIEDQIAAMKKMSTAVKREYDEKISAVKSYYSELRSQMNAAHSEEMAQMDARISRLRYAQQQEMRGYGTGPEQRKLNEMKIMELRRQAQAEQDQFRKQELLAEIERMENADKRRKAEARHAAAMRRAQLAKQQLEQEQAAEKKKLDEEEAARVKKLEEERKQQMQQIADALTSLADQKKEMSRQEKDEIEEVKGARDEAMSDYDAQIENQKNAKTKANEKALQEIENLRQAHEREKRAVEDIEYALEQNAIAASAVGDAVDSVTDGAMERQLTKVKQIRRQLALAKQDAASAAAASDGGSSTTTTTTTTSSLDGTRASGGPVRGGGTYQVNELGKEGFLSASGKLSQINAPSFGHWKAPASGTVVPAHIWKTLKASQATTPTMPKTVNPGNATARAISTINNTTGSQYNNSVTIQSVNPVQDANNMMVQMQRLRRGRR